MILRTMEIGSKLAADSQSAVRKRIGIFVQGYSNRPIGIDPTGRLFIEMHNNSKVGSIPFSHLINQLLKARMGSIPYAD